MKKKEKRKRLQACSGHLVGISFSGWYVKNENWVQESKHTSGLKTWLDALEKEMEEILDCPLWGIMLRWREQFECWRRFCRGYRASKRYDLYNGKWYRWSFPRFNITFPLVKSFAIDEEFYMFEAFPRWKPYVWIAAGQNNNVLE